jgi:pimeloyl-ACP methyl ester carboxylesterase
LTAQPIIYFHGIPGSPRELNLFGGRSHADILVIDRALQPNSGTELNAKIAAISKRFQARQVRVVAFSLGTRPALALASRLGDRVVGIDLISPGAPLTADDRAMAGYLIFNAARNFPALFAGITQAQALLARLAPSLLYKMLFKTAQGADKKLAQEAHFRREMRAILRGCFADGGHRYRAEISAYVAQWTTSLITVHQPVTLWHGTSDNWAPIAMTDRLAQTLPNVAAINRLDGLSHYSTLRAALKIILRDSDCDEGPAHA